jgi:mannose-6-phosphate isomerase-like protein (cupin superfamily)
MDNKPEISYGIQELPSIDEPIKSVEKYWGKMDTLFEGDDFTVKRIFMKAGSQSSLEYHVRKEESYYIESGVLRVGLRIGRAKNKSILLHKGDIFHIPVGLMHMRIAETDVVIIEKSSKDDDGDSHLVEDGKTYTHIETP